MRLISEVLGLYERNLIDMDEALHYYDLIRQHDMNILVHHKVIPLYYFNNIRWRIYDMRHKEHKSDEEILDYVIEQFGTIDTIGKFADNHTYPYKRWGSSTKLEDMYPVVIKNIREGKR